MRKLIALIAAVAFLAPAIAAAQSLTVARSQQGNVGPVVTATDPSGNSGKVVLQGVVPYDSSGAEKGTAGNPLITQPATGATSIVTQPTASNLNAQVVGNVASGAADGGNPVKVGGVFNTTKPTLTSGQRGDAQLSTKGTLLVTLADGTAGTSLSTTGPADGLSNAFTALSAVGFLELFNGSNSDRAFTCTSTASVNVTAGNTTQIVGLSGSTVIRVCSVSVSMSAAGTATFLTGTGTNCGTPSTIMTAMTLATGTPWQQSAPAGGSLFRSTAGGEICVTAATGNVTGFITYAQY